MRGISTAMNMDEGLQHSHGHEHGQGWQATVAGMQTWLFLVAAQARAARSHIL
jgi:hypothetical protein